MYLHLAYNRNMIVEGTQTKGIYGSAMIFL